MGRCSRSTVATRCSGGVKSTDRSGGKNPVADSSFWLQPWVITLIVVVVLAVIAVIAVLACQSPASSPPREVDLEGGNRPRHFGGFWPDKNRLQSRTGISRTGRSGRPQTGRSGRSVSRTGIS